MSRYGVEKASYDLADKSNQELFRRDGEGYLARYPLSADERRWLANGDVGALYAHGIAGGALSELKNFFDYDMVDYVGRLRTALGLPMDDAQMKILLERAGGKKRFT